MALRQRETLDCTIRIGSTPTFLYFDLYLNSAYAAHYVYFNIKTSLPRILLRSNDGGNVKDVWKPAKNKLYFLELLGKLDTKPKRKSDGTSVPTTPVSVTYHLWFVGDQTCCLMCGIRQSYYLPLRLCLKRKFIRTTINFIAIILLR